MPQHRGPRVRLVVDEDVADALVRVLEENDGPVLSRGPADDPGRFAFDLASVSVIVTLATALLFKEPVIPELVRLLRGRTEGWRFTAEGPAGRFEITSREGPVEERQIRALIEMAAWVGPAPVRAGAPGEAAAPGAAGGAGPAGAPGAGDGAVREEGA
ncbi:hypothetical protein [Actinacidiphila sp. ITFR-21]|uniref:hypothetical protein n=1 Tax=Actinacidiphila sp. ITFR-21 TaxID=3075199 RepID=UPI00288BDFB7|nr:hypothetical protein [Streptomyces sp. ITFR-21]WNI14752.1 hypothetical protein RLT57_03835 [Streptomyces sp. ITFR-21]